MKSNIDDLESTTTSTTTAPTTTAAVTTQQSTTLPPKPSGLLSCPSGSKTVAPYRAEFGFTLIEEGEFESMTITYGDGKSYTSASLEEAEQNMFWHQYAARGTYRISLAITDVYNRTSTAGCTFAWTEVQPTTTTTHTPPDADRARRFSPEHSR